MTGLNGRPIEVTEHAVNRLRRRRPDQALARAFIREEVELAIGEGRVTDHKPRDFRLYKSGGRILAHQRVVWTAGRELAFLIALEDEAVVVVTTFTPTGGARP